MDCTDVTDRGKPETQKERNKMRTLFRPSEKRSLFSWLASVKKTADYADRFLAASDTDALQLHTRFGAPGGRALPIGVIRAVRG